METDRGLLRPGCPNKIRGVKPRNMTQTNAAKTFNSISSSHRPKSLEATISTAIPAAELCEKWTMPKAWSAGRGRPQ